MVTSNDVPINDLIQAIAKEFKEMPEMKAPEWSFYVKTGNHKERPPVEKDWWYTRAAAVLRTVSVRGPIGVNKLRSKYGGKKNMGVRPEHTVKGSGSIARKILQQLESAKLIKHDKKGVHKGRIMTLEGIALLNKAAASVYKPAEKPVEKKTEEKPAKPVEKKAEPEKKVPTEEVKEKTVEKKAKPAPTKEKEVKKEKSETPAEKVEPKVEEKAPADEKKVEEAKPAPEVEEKKE